MGKGWGEEGEGEMNGESMDVYTQTHLCLVNSGEYFQGKQTGIFSL